MSSVECNQQLYYTGENEPPVTGQSSQNPPSLKPDKHSNLGSLGGGGEEDEEEGSHFNWKKVNNFFSFWFLNF